MTTDTVPQRETPAPPRGQTPQPPPQRRKVQGALSDSIVMIERHLHHLTRNPDQMFTAIMLPTVMLLLFRYMFGGAIGGSTSTTEYINYLAPGILVVSITLISTSTTLAVQSDMQEGVVDRLRSMPMFDAAVLTGHIVAAVIRGAVAFVVMIGLGLLVGFRPSGGVLDWIGAIGMLLLFAYALSWVSAVLGLVAKSTEGASGLALILMFSPYASSAFVPLDTLPGGLRGFVEHQPVTLVVDTVRALLIGAPVGDAALPAVIWWSAILLVAAPVATWLYRRRFA